MNTTNGRTICGHCARPGAGCGCTPAALTAAATTSPPVSPGPFPPGDPDSWDVVRRSQFFAEVLVATANAPDTDPAVKDEIDAITRAVLPAAQRHFNLAKAGMPQLPAASVQQTRAPALVAAAVAPLGAIGRPVVAEPPTIPDPADPHGVLALAGDSFLGGLMQTLASFVAAGDWGRAWAASNSLRDAIRVKAVNVGLVAAADTEVVIDAADGAAGARAGNVVDLLRQADAFAATGDLGQAFSHVQAALSSAKGLVSNVERAMAGVTAARADALEERRYAGQPDELTRRRMSRLAANAAATKLSQRRARIDNMAAKRAAAITAG